MPLEKIEQVKGRAVFVPGNDIDTDRIIPARFMKCVSFDGLGQYAFYDVRFDEKGQKRGHPLDALQHQGATVLLSGKNFGCGSSREHAPQALQKFGLRAIIAESFAEIFAGNCTMLGIPCVMASAADIADLAGAVAKNPQLELVVDLKAQVIRCGAKQAPLQTKPGAREALMKGEWDPLGQLLDAREQVAAVAAKIGYFSGR